jgi:hypothetical protein
MPSPCIVIGNLKQLSNGVIAQGQIIFELANIGIGNPITVVGTGIFPALKYTAYSAADGSFTQTLWGNDNISPANTIYNVTYRDNLGSEIGSFQYSITGTLVNLNSLAAISTVLPPVLFSIPNSARFTASGSNLVSGDFLLTGWGTGATISAIHGCDMAHRFTITAGTTPSVSPTIRLTFHDGAWAFPPIILANMINGTGQVSDFGVVSATTIYTLTYDGLPTATKTYILHVVCIGVLS